MLADIFGVCCLVAAAYIAFTYKWEQLGTEIDNTTE